MRRPFSRFCTPLACLLAFGAIPGLQAGEPASGLLSAEALRRQRIFEEPLQPLGAEPTARENADLQAALAAFERAGDPERMTPFLRYLQAHPNSPWSASLWSNLGAAYHRHGYVSKALEAWQTAWSLSRNVTAGAGRAVPERAGSGLVDLYARLGRQAELESLLKELDRQPAFHGAAGDRVIAAKGALDFMKAQPDQAFVCGPIGLACIMSSLGLDSAPAHAEKSTAKGTSLAHNLDVATRLGLTMQLASRKPGAPMVVPALVHLKAGHFAAVVQAEDGRYLVKDPTFDGERWISARALDVEASGAMLVPAGRLPEGFLPLSKARAAEVWGSGFTTQDCDLGGGDDVGGGTCPVGMATYAIHAQTTGLKVKDTPLLYTPPKGPSIPFTVSYFQRQVRQPQTFTYSNLGPKWTFSFLSYLEDADPPAGLANPGPGEPVGTSRASLDGSGTRMKQAMRLGGGAGAGGGAGSYYKPNLLDALGVSYPFDFVSRTFRGFPASAPQQMTQETLVRPTTSSYEKIHVNGTRYVFDRVTVLSPGFRRIFLTKVIDRDGNQLSINYDAQMRVTTVVDALGQVTTLSYELASDPLKITKITDPFGRFASFEYNAAGQLARITDVVGITSEFTYGPTPTSPTAAADFLNSLKTPYGTTTFDVAESYRVRTVTATDPMGNKERVEARANSTQPAADGSVPSGVANQYLNYRNTFFWNKRAMAQYPGDYTKAEITHWVHHDLNGAAFFPIPESRVKPGESRIWYQYPAQSAQWVSGSLNLPTRTARLLPDGSTQETKATYNSAGKVDTSTDAMGRITKYVYASPDFEDLLEVRNITGGANELLSAMTYDANHRPLTVTDAAGQTTTYTYNAAGQVLTVTNPLGQTTTMAYNPQGYLASVTGAVTGATTTFAYDAYGRVATVTGPDGNATTTEYDDLNRPTKVTYSDGTFEQMVYDKLDLVRSRDRKGRWTFMTYNPLRQLSEVEDAQGRVTRFDWCGCGSQLESLTDPMGRVTQWLRDLNGKVVAKVLDDRTRTTYAYDTAGRLTQRTDAKGQFTLYDYFADGALKQVSYPNAQRPTPTVSYTYDAKYSRLATMTDGIGTTQYAYQAITTPPVPGAGRLASVDGPWANDTITYQYDALGRVVNRAIAGVAETRFFDALGRISNVTNALGAFTYTYDGLTSRLKQVDFPNGQKTKYTYDGPEFRLKSIENLKSDNSNISTFGYTYDLDGQIKTWSQAADAQAPKTYTFDYDAVNQLTGAVLNGPNGELLRQYTYGYDLMGNRTSEGVDGATTTSGHNNTNQLMSQRYSLNTEAIRKQEEALKLQKAKAEAAAKAAAPAPAKAKPAKPAAPAAQR